MRSDVETKCNTSRPNFDMRYKRINPFVTIKQGTIIRRGFRRSEAQRWPAFYDKLDMEKLMYQHYIINNEPLSYYQRPTLCIFTHRISTLRGSFSWGRINHRYSVPEFGFNLIKQAKRNRTFNKVSHNHSFRFC